MLRHRRWENSGRRVVDVRQPPERRQVVRSAPHERVQQVDCRGATASNPGRDRRDGKEGVPLVEGKKALIVTARLFRAFAGASGRRAEGRSSASESMRARRFFFWFLEPFFSRESVLCKYNTS